MKPPLQISLALGFWLIGCAGVQARIGETEKQCEERYGKPIEVSKDKMEQIYRKAGLIVVGHFHNGICEYIAFQKADKNAAGLVEDISENERSVLLKANGGGRDWKVIEDAIEGIFYETKDGEIHAGYTKSDERTLVIMTHESVLRRAAANKAEEEKKLKGF